MNKFAVMEHGPRVRECLLGRKVVFYGPDAMAVRKRYDLPGSDSWTCSFYGGTGGTGFLQETSEQHVRDRGFDCIVVDGIPDEILEGWDPPVPVLVLREHPRTGTHYDTIIADDPKEYQSTTFPPTYETLYDNCPSEVAASTTMNYYPQGGAADEEILDNPTATPESDAVEFEVTTKHFHEDGSLTPKVMPSLVSLPLVLIGDLPPGSIIGTWAPLRLFQRVVTRPGHPHLWRDVVDGFVAPLEASEGVVFHRPDATECNCGQPVLTEGLCGDCLTERFPPEPSQKKPMVCLKGVRPGAGREPLFTAEEEDPWNPKKTWP